LEDVLGVDLFVRERGNIHLTDAGEALITHAKSMMTLWAKARQEIAMPGGALDTLSIGGLSGLWDITLQDWLNDVYAENKTLVITADIYGSETLLKRVMEGTLDVAFLYDAPQGVNLTSQLLKPIRLRLVSAAPVTQLEDGWMDDFIQVDWGLNFAVSFAAEFPDLAGVRLVTGLGRIALEHLKRGSGYAYLAENTVADLVKKKELHYVPNAPVFERSAYALYHQENPKLELIQRLVKSL
jgi:DNA-binding transcriptional LysR family regulator